MSPVEETSSALSLSERKAEVLVEPRFDMTLEQMIALMRAGHEIIYTPHIGNKHREDQFLTQQGVPQVTFHRNQGYVDDIDCPHAVLIKDERLEAATYRQKGVVSPHLELDGKHADQIRERFGDRFGTRLATMHHSSTQAAIPGQYELGDRYSFLKDATADRVMAVLDAHAQKPGSDVFNRELVDGRINKKMPPRRDSKAVQDFADMVGNLADRVEGTSDKQVDGPVVRNGFNIYSFVLRALLREQEQGRLNPNEVVDVYTVAGPSMINYAKTLRPELTAYHQTARELDASLPPQVRLSVLPGALFDFMPTDGDTELRGLIEQIVELELKSQELNVKLGQKGVDKRSLIAEKKQIAAQQKELTVQFLAMRKKLPFFSQYDALDTGHSIQGVAGLEQITFRSIRNLFHEK